MKSYRLLKDIPGVKAGTIFRRENDVIYIYYPETNFKDGVLRSDRYSYFQKDMDNTEWFEEVIEHTDLHLVAGQTYEYYYSLFIEKLNILGIKNPANTIITSGLWHKMWKLAASKGIEMNQLINMELYLEDDLRDSFNAARNRPSVWNYKYLDFEDYINQIKKQ